LKLLRTGCVGYVKNNGFLCFMAFLNHSVDVICKLFDVLRIQLRCIILEWSVVLLGSRISENLLRQHLSHPADILPSLSLSYIRGTTSEFMVTKVSEYPKPASHVMIMRQGSECDSVLDGGDIFFSRFLSLRNSLLSLHKTFPASS
jgi:hypothetical protein